MEKRIEIVDARRRALLKSGLAASAAMTIGLPVSATGGVVPCGATAIWEE